MVPLSVGGNLIGWLGFDSADPRKEWPSSTTAILQVVGEMVAGAIDRKRADEAD
jgi:GAF domain-containing protein